MTDLPKLDTIELEVSDNIGRIKLNRPKKYNALNNQMWLDIKIAFDHMSTRDDVRVVILSGNGKHFTAGLDLMSAASDLMAPGEDVGRKAVWLHNLVKRMQSEMSSAEECRVPVIAAIHGYCLGAGIDLTSACDIRYAVADTKFSIKEIDVGMTADVGTLQRFPKIVGNDSWVRELALTGRVFDGNEAKENGFISGLCLNKEELDQKVEELAKTIASKSPVAVVGTKQTLIYSRDHSVASSLHQVRTMNSAMLQSNDVATAATAAMMKQKAEYAKL